MQCLAGSQQEQTLHLSLGSSVGLQRSCTQLRNYMHVSTVQNRLNVQLAYAFFWLVCLLLACLPIHSGYNMTLLTGLPTTHQEHHSSAHQHCTWHSTLNTKSHVHPESEGHTECRCTTTRNGATTGQERSTT